MCRTTSDSPCMYFSLFLLSPVVFVIHTFTVPSCSRNLHTKPIHRHTYIHTHSHTHKCKHTHTFSHTPWPHTHTHTIHIHTHTHHGQYWWSVGRSLSPTWHGIQSLWQSDAACHCPPEWSGCGWDPKMTASISAPPGYGTSLATSQSPACNETQLQTCFTKQFLITYLPITSSS